MNQAFHTVYFAALERIAVKKKLHSAPFISLTSLVPRLAQLQAPHTHTHTHTHAYTELPLDFSHTAVVHSGYQMSCSSERVGSVVGEGGGRVVWRREGQVVAGSRRVLVFQVSSASHQLAVVPRLSSSFSSLAVDEKLDESWLQLVQLLSFVCEHLVTAC